MPVVKCPYCEHIWTPRSKKPRWCPECKRWVKGHTIQVTDTEQWAIQKRNPLWEKEGDLVVSDEPVPCSLCKRRFKRLVEIENKRYCGECIYRLLKEDTVSWKV